MEKYIKFAWYWLEIVFYKTMRIFGKRQREDVIPIGLYCYDIDQEKNKRVPLEVGFWIKMCPYYRGRQNVYPNACTYTGFVGFDVGLYDQCKICGVTTEFDKDIN